MHPVAATHLIHLVPPPPNLRLSFPVHLSQYSLSVLLRPLAHQHIRPHRLHPRRVPANRRQRARNARISPQRRLLDPSPAARSASRQHKVHLTPVHLPRRFASQPLRLRLHASGQPHCLDLTPAIKPRQRLARRSVHPLTRPACPLLLPFKAHATHHLRRLDPPITPHVDLPPRRLHPAASTRQLHPIRSLSPLDAPTLLRQMHHQHSRRQRLTRATIALILRQRHIARRPQRQPMIHPIHLRMPRRQHRRSTLPQRRQLHLALERRHPRVRVIRRTPRLPRHPAIDKPNRLIGRGQAQALHIHQPTRHHMNRLRLALALDLPSPNRAAPRILRPVLCTHRRRRLQIQLHLAHRPNHAVLLVVVELLAIDPVRPSILLPVQHNPHILEPHPPVLVLRRLRRVDRENRSSLHRLRPGKAIRLFLDIRAQPLRQVPQQTMRPVMRQPQKARHDHRHQGRPHHHRRPYLLDRRPHEPSPTSSHPAPLPVPSSPLLAPAP